MKTLPRHIEIEFTLTYLGLDDFALDLSYDNGNPYTSYKMIAKGILLGTMDKVLTTQIIFNN